MRARVLPQRMRAALSALPWIVGLALTAFVAMWIWVASFRAVYPFELDFLEDDILVEAWRIARGLPVFLPPNADFVPHAYAPLYMLLSALLLSLTGPSFLPMRLLSLLATLCSCGLLFWAAYRVARRFTVALLAPGLFLAGYALTGAQYELARVDGLYITLVLAGACIGLSGGDTRRGRVGTALCLAAAFYTKQTALVFGSGMAAYLLATQGRRAFDYAALYISSIALPMIVMDRFTDGWSTFYMIVVPQGDPVALSRLSDYVRHDLLQNLGPLCAMLATLLLFRMRGGPKQERLARDWPVFALLAVLASGWMRARLGGNLNSLLPAYAFLSLIPVLLYAELSRPELRELAGSQSSSVKGFPASTFQPASELLLLAILWQLALCFYNPLSHLPRPGMRESGQRLVERISQVEGPVLVLEHPYYALLAGKEAGVALTALWHARLHGAAPLPPDLVTRIQSRYYSLVIADDGEYPEVTAATDDLLNAYYRQLQPEAASDGPATLSGVIIRPHYYYLPTQ